MTCDSSGSFRVTLLGTGSPSPNLTRHHPAALVQWGAHGRALVDAGDGVVSQLQSAGIMLREVELVLLSHMHWDHILGYPAFVWGSWTQGRTKLEVFGPEGTAAMHAQLVEAFYRDQAEWAINLGYDRRGWDAIDVREVSPGWSSVVDGCRIEAGIVVHPPMASLAYRFTFDQRSVVISGDTARCQELIDFSRGADMLVVDACAAPPPEGSSPARAALIRRLHEFHASPQDGVDMANAAGVKTVVLTHHLPEVTPSVDVSGYSGTVVIGQDLQTITV